MKRKPTKFRALATRAAGAYARSATFAKRGDCTSTRRELSRADELYERAWNANPAASGALLDLVQARMKVARIFEKACKREAPSLFSGTSHARVRMRRSKYARLLPLRK